MKFNNLTVLLVTGSKLPEACRLTNGRLTLTPMIHALIEAVVYHNFIQRQLTGFWP